MHSHQLQGRQSNLKRTQDVGALVGCMQRLGRDGRCCDTNLRLVGLGQHPRDARNELQLHEVMTEERLRYQVRPSLQ